MKSHPVKIKLNTAISIILFFGLFHSAIASECDGLTKEIFAPKEYTLSDLAGVWALQDSNKNMNEGIEISVTGNQGTITNKANSSYKMGAVKWMSIVKSIKNTFIYQELGSDALRYCASLKFLDKDTIEIRVDAPGVGSVQKWVRKSSPIKNPINASLTDYSVNDLAGIWFRKASNNPKADGIEVEVSGTKGTIINKAGSNFAVGHIKWSSISKKTPKTFSYKELGSDNNYYNATIKFVTKDKLEVRVGHSGAGNSQTWIRKGSEEATEGVTFDLVALEGRWRLSASNGASYDGMVINIKGNTAKIISTKTRSNYKKETTKWKGIIQGDGNEYAFTDIDHNGTPSFAVIRKKDNNVLKVSLAASVAGNEQTWQRVKETDQSPVDNDDVNPPPTIAAKKISCDIISDTTLKNTPAAVDYYVDCVIDVTAALTIEPGVVIEFQENSGLGVYDNGSINAVGTSDKKIEFRGKESLPGFWRGIYVETNSTRNVIKHATIKNAGSNYVYCCYEKASIFLKDGQLRLQNSVISYGGGCGVFVRAEARLIESGNIFARNKAGNICHGKPPLLPEDITTATTLVNTPRPVDYVVPANKVIDVTAALTIEPGVVIEFQENSGLGVYDNGSINAVGTSDKKIEFRGKESLPGFWRGIYVETNSTRNVIKHATIKNAGSNYVYCCYEKARIFLKDGQLRLQNSVISYGGGCGVFVRAEARLIESGNIFARNKAGNICHGKPPLLPEDITTATTLVNTPRPVDYVVPANKVIDVTAALTIEPGVVIEFQENSGLGVYDNGSINAVGTSDKKIEFRGKESLQGFWRGIYVETNSTRNVIKHATIKNAGSNYVYCCYEKASIFLKDGRLRLENSFISDSGGCGVFVKAGVTLNESGNTFSNNAEGHICN